MRATLRAFLAVCGFLVVTPALAGDGGCAPMAMDPVPNVDIQKVREEWLQWTNRLRRQHGLEPYVLSASLNDTASNWSTYAVRRGFIDHKRAPGAPYYDYRGIESWFDQKGLQFANVNRTTFTENIGWGVYRCKGGDCTRKLVGAIRSTFNMYLAERARASKPHWNSLVNAHFREIGVGVATDPDRGRYYLTVHYATDISADERVACAK